MESLYIRKKLRLIFLLFFLLSIPFINTNSKNQSLTDKISISRVLLIFNSNSVEYNKPFEHISEYLEHFGIIYDLLDLSKQDSVNFDNYNLLLFTHDSIFCKLSQSEIEKIKLKIDSAIEDSAGILSFCSDIINDSISEITGSMETVYFSNNHFITQNHTKGDSVVFLNSINDKFKYNTSFDVLISSNNIPLLSCSSTKNGNIAYWSTSSWMSDNYLGPLRDLDDCFLNSIIWTAKKPFFIRGLLPIVTMRVDDVYGIGPKWKESPFNWVKIANEFKFKPWLGLFIHSMDNESIIELRDLISKGECTSMVHSFTVSDLIFYNHAKAQTFSNEISLSNLKLVDEWYNITKLPKSKYLLPHYYEIGSIALKYAYENWGTRYLGFIPGPDKSYWWDKAITMKPFKFNRKSVVSGYTPSFAYADYYNIEENKFFVGLTEIRDWGYDWAPTNDVKSSIQRGAKILNRTLQTMTFTELFTHEATYLKNLNPNNWKLILKGITESIVKYDPIYLTVDSAMQILESTYNSKLSSVSSFSGGFEIDFDGSTTAPTSLYVYTQNIDKSINKKMFEIPIFNSKYKFNCLSSEIEQVKEIITDTFFHYNSDEVLLSRNPIGSSFSILLPNRNELYNISFYDNMGVLIYSSNCRESTSFNANMFPDSGIYFARIKGSKNDKTIKIIYRKLN